MMTGSVLVATKQTPMQRIDLRVLPDGECVLALDGFVQFVSGDDDAAYHGALARTPASMLGPDPFSAIILGGGDGLAARDLVRLPNLVHADMVEIDKGMLEFCSTHPVLRAINEDVFMSSKLRTKVGDARNFVAAEPRRRYELAVVDFPDPTPGLYDLFQWPFYAALLKHMNPERWVIAVQSSTDGEPVETYVTSHLMRATNRPCRRIPFKGRYMPDGVVVVASSA
jgi:spermidine synthase